MRSAMSVWVMAVALGLGGGAAAQVDLARREGTLFTIEDVDALDRAAGLSGEQRRAVRTLMLEAMAELRLARQAAQAREVQRREEVEARGPAESVEAELAKPDPLAVKVPDAAALERRTYDAVRALLSEEQAGRGWEAYLRYRRALAIEGLVRGDGPGAPRMASLEALVREAGLGEEDRARALAAIDLARERMDSAVKRLIDAARREAAAGTDGERAEGERLEAEKAVRREQVRACVAMQEAVSAEGKTMLLRRRVEREGVLEPLRQFAGLWLLDQVGEWTRDATLSVEVREELGDMRARARAAALDIAIPVLEERDRSILAGRAWVFERDAQRSVRKRVYAITSQLRADAVAILPKEMAEAWGDAPLTTEQLHEMFYGAGRGETP